MAADINNVTIVARLARDPELRSLASGTSVCSLRVAFNTSKKTANGWEDNGNFIDVSVWGNQGETVARNMTKGQRIGISGRLEVREFTDKDGNKRSAPEIHASSVQFLDPKQDGAGGGQRAAASSAPASRPAAAPVANDDVPF